MNTNKPLKKILALGHPMIDLVGSVNKEAYNK